MEDGDSGTELTVSMSRIVLISGIVAAVLNLILPQEDPIDDVEGVIDEMGHEHGEPDVERIGDVEDIRMHHEKEVGVNEVKA